MKTLKKIIIAIFGVLVLSVGLALVCYPFISNYLMSKNHDSEIAAQAEAVNMADSDTLDEMFAQAEIYNRNKISTNTRLFQPKCRNNAEVTYI